MKKKVLIFNSNITTSGITKVISEYSSNFSENIHAEIMTFSIINDIYLKDKKIKVHVIGDTKNIIKRIKREMNIIKSNNYDIVHINGDIVSRVIECISAKLARVNKIIVHSHTMNITSGGKLKKAIHTTFKKLFDYFATDFLACSYDAAVYMFSKKIINQKKYVIINNGIEVDKFKFNNNIRKELRNQYNLNNKLVIGTVGRLNYEKNQKFLIELFNYYQKKNKESILIIIGDGPLKDELKRKVAELKINDKVLFLGSINDVYKFYNAMDCFILPSLHEGLGIVNIEAQTSGLPVIVSTGVPKEAKISDLLSFVSLEEDLDKWVNKIRINKNREKAYMCTIKSDYNISEGTKKIEKIYMK